MMWPELGGAALGFALVTAAFGLGSSRGKLNSTERTARAALVKDFGRAMAADDGAALRQLQAVSARKQTFASSVPAPRMPASIAAAGPTAPSEPAPTPPEVTTLLRGYLDRPEIRPEVDVERGLLGADTPEAILAVTVAMNSSRRLNDEDARVREAMMDYLTNDPRARAVEVFQAYQNLRAQRYVGPERETLKMIGNTLVARARAREKARADEERARAAAIPR